MDQEGGKGSRGRQSMHNIRLRTGRVEGLTVKDQGRASGKGGTVWRQRARGTTFGTAALAGRLGSLQSRTGGTAS